MPFFALLSNNHFLAMHANRALWVASGSLLLAIAAFHLRQSGPHASFLPPCLFHEATGLHCVGCGMTRASHAALNGRFVDAISFNPLGLFLLPIAGCGIALELIAWVRGKSNGPRLNLGRRGIWMLAWLILAFWILRNVPAWPFTFLAPNA